MTQPQAQSKVQAVTSSCDSTKTLIVTPWHGQGSSVTARAGFTCGHPQTHTKNHLRGVKAKEPTGVKGKMWIEQPQQVREGTGSIPKGPAPSQLAPAAPSQSQKEFRDKPEKAFFFTFSSSFNRFSSSFFLFSSSFALENKECVNCHPPGGVYF